MQRLYDKAPGMVGRNFRYVDIDPVWQSRDIKPALEDLMDANIITKIQATAASGIPLATGAIEKKFKLLFQVPM